MKLFIVITAALILGGANATTVGKTLIHGVKSAENSITILVTSTGCTNQNSFQLIWHEDEVTLNKVKQDNCRRMPHRIWLTFDLANINAPFKIMNYISP